MRRVQMFVSHSGKAPFEQWMRSLRDKRTKARILTRIDRVRRTMTTENMSAGGANVKSYEEFLQEELHDPELAAAYLTAALTEGSAEEFLLALRSVADAHGGMGAVAEAADLNRQTLYRTLSSEGNPTISTLRSVLRVLGLDLAFTPVPPST